MGANDLISNLCSFSSVMEIANEEVTNAQFVIKSSIKNNTLMRPEEGYQHAHLTRDSGSSRVCDCRDNRSVQAVPRKTTGKLPHHKVVESPTAEPSLSGKCGRELVNARVMVWWPLDKVYYAGTIVSFDPLTNKHGIEYYDGDEETLNLSEERRELYNETPFQLSFRKLEVEPSSAEEPAEIQKKTTEGMAGMSKKERAGSSSKGSKGKGRCSAVRR